MTDSIPTLDELLERLEMMVEDRESIRELYRMVACGELHPTEPSLPENVIILAAQSMVILFDHVDIQKNER